MKKKWIFLLINSFFLLTAMDNQKRLEEIDEFSEEKDTQNKLVNYFEKNSIRNCFSYIKKLTDKEKELFRQAIIAKYEALLKRHFKTGFNSFIAGADYDLVKLTGYHKCDVDQNWAETVKFTRDSKKAMTTSILNSCIWETTTGKILKSFDMNDQFADCKDNSQVFDLDGKYMFYQNKFDQKIYQIDSDSGKKYKEFIINGELEFIDFSHCGRYLATAQKIDKNDCAKVWNMETGEITHQFSVKNVSDIKFSCDSKYLAVASIENHAFVIDLNLNKQIKIDAKEEFVEKDLVLTKMLFTQNNLITLHYNVVKPSYILFWDVVNGNLSKKFRFENAVIDFDVSFDGKFMLIARDDEHLNIIDSTNGNIITYRYKHQNNIDKVALSKDGNFLILGFMLHIGSDDDYEACQILNFSNSWIIDKLNLKRLIFITKLLANPEMIDILQEKKYKEFYYMIPILLRKQFHVPLLSYYVNKIYQNKMKEIGYIILEYLDNDLSLIQETGLAYRIRSEYNHKKAISDHLKRLKYIKKSN